MEKNKKSMFPKSTGLDNFSFEEKYWQEGAYLCGVDEVGRGCLAGPIVTAAVILKPFSAHTLLVDSKILSETRRLAAAEWIFNNSWYAFGMADHREVDFFGVYVATQRAMLRAVYALLSQPHTPKPAKIVIDAMPLQLNQNLPQIPEIESFFYGETRSISIAAASIIAKVQRDALLRRFHPFYAQYGLDEHKGYGTKAHMSALKMCGATLIHRTTFIKHIDTDMEYKNDQKKQGTLFC